MKRRNYLLTFIVTMLLLSLQGISVQASDHLVEVSLEVSQVLEGHVVDAKGTFKYMLTSENESNPLPENAKSAFVFEIEGSNTLRLPTIKFMEFGTYIYTVKQIAPTLLKE